MADPPAASRAIHATAVSIAGRALLIRGRSRSGKSTLALDLIAASRPGRAILLVGDDRVLLARGGASVLVSPHPLIAGLIEKRGQGLLRMPHRRQVPLAAIVDLEPPSLLDPSRDGAVRERGRQVVERCDLLGQNFPASAFVYQEDWATRGARVLAWFAASMSHACLNKRQQPSGFAKD